MNCVKCSGNGVKFCKSEQLGTYSLRCNHCDGTGVEPVTTLAMLLRSVIIVALIGIFGLFLYY